MATVSLPIVGPTYTNRSLSVNAQVTRNFYIEINKEGGEAVSLMPFPGLKLFGTTGSGTNRGMGEHNNVAYTITDNMLYSVASNGLTTAVGEIPGSGQCVLVSDGLSLVITTGESKPLTWDESTLRTGTDADLPSAATVAYINRRVVYDGAGASLAFADLDVPLAVNSLNVTTVNSTPDDVLAVVAQDLQVIVFGEKSITPYYNSGAGNPPFDVIQNAVRNIGLKAIHSLAKNREFIYFLGSDSVIYRYGGLQVQAISNPAISNAIEGYGDISGARGVTFTLQGQNFYCITFPGNETWLYNEGVGWTNLADGTDGEPHRMCSYLHIYDKHLVADTDTGNIYELDFDTHEDNGTVIQRQRDTVNVSGKMYGKPGAKLFMDRLELILETGTSIISGQGSDAKVMMSYSDDNGRSFSSERWMSVGAQGEYRTRLEWYGLGSFYNRIFRFKMSDPIKWTLISLHADIELGDQ